jgi:hypothetical protein
LVAGFGDSDEGIVESMVGKLSCGMAGTFLSRIESDSPEAQAKVVDNIVLRSENCNLEICVSMRSERTIA